MQSGPREDWALLKWRLLLHDLHRRSFRAQAESVHLLEKGSCNQLQSTWMLTAIFYPVRCFASLRKPVTACSATSLSLATPRLITKPHMKPLHWYVSVTYWQQIYRVS